MIHERYLYKTSAAVDTVTINISKVITYTKCS